MYPHSAQLFIHALMCDGLKIGTCLSKSLIGGGLCALGNAVMAHVYLPPRPAQSASQRSPGEGANLDRRLVHHGKCKRIQSRIEFIYLYASTTVLMHDIGKIGPGK